MERDILVIVEDDEERTFLRSGKPMVKFFEVMPGEFGYITEVFRGQDRQRASIFREDLSRRQAHVIEEGRKVGIAGIDLIPEVGSFRTSSQLATSVVLPEPAGPDIQTTGLLMAWASRWKSLFLCETPAICGRVILADERYSLPM
ncbi:MAG: hypothetical protein EHM36_03035 [Deltaproteobacteria bacterium]|nr:MAG: hypothetical protein EHM36_03035 [Deltaproteobacteria bacterium]